jgi:DNA invertase Pin-like site-specific DNA recombinase
MKESPPSPIAYSYLRFSDAEQRKGQSIRRQKEAAAAWCQRNGVDMDKSLTLHDKGCSAYRGLHRDNPDKHALALFLKLIEKGRVHPGDYLLVENLDRLSREEEVPACHLLTGILVAGVRVVQLSPYEMLLTEKSTGWELMRAVMELSRGHGESAIKSVRVNDAWQKRLEWTRNGEVVLTRQLPAWLEVRGDKLYPIPARAAVVKRIYQLATAGYGHVRIVKVLVAEGNTPFGAREWYTDEEGELHSRALPGDVYGSGKWTKAYVAKILKDERVLGKFQPRKADGSPDGPELENYFPAIVTQAEWDAAREGATRRGQANGRKTNGSTKHIDIFAGLMKDARDGGAMFCTTRTAGGRHTRVFIPANGRNGDITALTFPYDAYEDSILSKLEEIPASEVAGEEDAPNEVAVLSGELARVESSIAAVAAELDNGESPTLFARLRKLEARQAELTKELDEARRRASHPLAEAWGEVRSLAKLLKDAEDKDDMRIRLRTALRRSVKEIHLLIVPRGRARLCACQVYFSGADTWRLYVVYFRPPWGGPDGCRHEAKWQPLSFASADEPVDWDLRRRGDVKEMEEVLAALELPK